MDTFIQAVKELLKDIEGMQERPDTFPEQFGPFSEAIIDEDDGRAIIEWPNLAISVAKVKALLVDQAAKNLANDIASTFDDALLKAQRRTTDLAFNKLPVPGYQK